MNLVFDGSQAQKEIMNKQGEPLKYHIRYENMVARLLALKQSGVEGYHLKIRNGTRRKTQEEIEEKKKANRSVLAKFGSFIWSMIYGK